MPCRFCRVLATYEAGLVGLKAPGPLASEDVPVKFHPVAFPQHNRVAMAWRGIWDDPKICGGCGSWFSERWPPSKASEPSR